MRVPKPFQFIAVLVLLIGLDTLLPRPADWPAPLVARARWIALVTSGEAPAPAQPPSVEVAKAPEAPALPPMFGPEPPPKPLKGAFDDKALFLVPDDRRWDALQAKLGARAAGKPAVVRVLHVGDSEIANDFVARTLRRHFVERYGDAGPGFALALAPWNWYERESFKNVEPESFVSRSVALTRKGDGNFGPGGVAFDARSRNALAELEVEAKGRDACEVALLYGVQPQGAELELLADGKPLERVPTAGEGLAVGRKELRLAPCPGKLAVKALGTPARVFGWSVEWGQPGVVWSPLGVVGASSEHFLRYGEGRIGDALASLKPDLLVVAHGLNVANKPVKPPEEERQGLRRLLEELRSGAPEAACLVMSPYPIAYADGDQVAPSTSTTQLAKMQRQVAHEQGCAFLDRLELEGGPKTALRWLNARPRMLSGDYVHLTDRGSEKVGTDVAQTLLTRLSEATN